jgi:hypothetical protein
MTINTSAIGPIGRSGDVEGRFAIGDRVNGSGESELDRSAGSPIRLPDHPIADRRFTSPDHRIARSPD